MLRDVKASQRHVRMLLFRVNGQTVAGGTSTRTGILEGTYDARITENSDGNYTFVFDHPFARVPVIALQSATDALTLNLVAVSATGFQVEQCSSDQTTPVADGAFHATVTGFDTADAT